jgi:hypothetical protein
MLFNFQVQNVDDINPGPSEETVTANVSGIPGRFRTVYLDCYQLFPVPETMKDPDRRVGEAIALIFAKFAEMQSVRQVHVWFRHERVPVG